MSPEQREELLRALKARFEKYMNRHKGIEWAQVQTKLEAHAEKLPSLSEMETTGGEPDVVGHDKNTGEYIFYDCSAESPKGRRSVCYDREALESRKEHKPKRAPPSFLISEGVFTQLDVFVSKLSIALSSVPASTRTLLIVFLLRRRIRSYPNQWRSAIASDFWAKLRV